jgi:TfoX/Sxy family transcriptional regulator of competence genes
MPKTAAGAPADKVALYEKLVATDPRVERKGAALPYTSLNGNMFSILGKDGVLCLRLSEKARDAFVAKYKTKPVVMYGTLMKEYVAVPDALFAKTAELKPYFAASYAYAESLRVKPTTKKPKAKSGSPKRA